MTLTSAEDQRIRKIEVFLSDLKAAFHNLAPKRQTQQLLLMKQKEIDTLTERVEVLESQMQELQRQIG